MTVRTLALVGLARLVVSGCTDDGSGPRRVRLESATAVYAEERPSGGHWDDGMSPWPEVEASFLLDGKPVGTCSKRWFRFEVTCGLEADVEVHDDSRIDLVVADRDGTSTERIGSGKIENVRSKLPQRGHATVEMTSDGSVKSSRVTLEAQWGPIVPLTEAFVVLGIAGLACAFLLYALMRQRFLTHDEQYRRSVAMVTAVIATLLGCGLLIPVLPSAKAMTLEPLVIAAPTCLGAYALTAVIIDSVGSRRWGRQRARLATAAVLATITLPAVIGFAAVSVKLKIVVAIIAALVVLFT